MDDWRSSRDVLLNIRFWTTYSWACLTKERRYDSKDSREIEKGSFSLNRLRWLEVVEGDLLQNDLLSSLGDG